MKQMSIRKQIRVQRLQDKNRMVGQTFNPSGITSEQIVDRESKFVSEFRLKTFEERKEYWSKVQEMIESRTGSWAWQWCAFQRNFIINNEVV